MARMESLFAAIAAKDMVGIEACYLNDPSLLVFVEGPRMRNVGWESIRVGWRHFLDASMETRARRRQAELAAAGRPEPLDTVRDEITVRDAQDRTRVLAPLRKAPDAMEVDTSDRTADEVIAVMLEAVERHRCCTRS